jgi:hypothetical protein
MSEENKTEKPVEPAAPVIPDMVQLLSTFENSPSQTDIESWKQKFGEIFVSGFSETEMFVWRPLQRGEYVSLQKKLREPSKETGEQPSELDFEEWVVQTCILWSSNKKICLQKGGTVTTLSEQIMTNSNFLNPQMAAMLVMKL